MSPITSLSQKTYEQNLALTNELKQYTKYSFNITTIHDDFLCINFPIVDSTHTFAENIVTNVFLERTPLLIYAEEQMRGKGNLDRK